MKEIARGVDLSEFNGSVDFPALIGAGVKFVILRAGYGGDFPGQEDRRFEENVRRAEEYGLPWGVYHFSYAKNAASGKAEAAHVLRLLKGRKPAYGVWLDMEAVTTLDGDLAGAADGFCSAIREAGLYAGVYASVSWFTRYLTSPVFDKYDKWVAQYNSVCQYAKPYGMWQFTDKLVIGGKSFDGSIAYKDYPALTGAEEENGLTEEQVKVIAAQAAREAVARYLEERALQPVSGWAEESVRRAMALGLMKGDAGGGFRPRSFITREEAAEVAINTVNAAVRKVMEAGSLTAVN